MTGSIQCCQHHLFRGWSVIDFVQIMSPADKFIWTKGQPVLFSIYKERNKSYILTVSCWHAVLLKMFHNQQCIIMKSSGPFAHCKEPHITDSLDIFLYFGDSAFGRDKNLLGHGGQLHCFFVKIVVGWRGRKRMCIRKKVEVLGEENGRKKNKNCLQQGGGEIINIKKF